MSYNPFFSVMLALGVAGRAAIGTDGRRVVTGATGMTVVKLASPVSALPPGDVRRGRVDGRESLMVATSAICRCRSSPALRCRGAPPLGAGMVPQIRCRRRFPCLPWRASWPLPPLDLEGVVIAAASPARVAWYQWWWYWASSWICPGGSAGLRTFGKFR